MSLPSDGRKATLPSLSVLRPKGRFKNILPIKRSITGTNRSGRNSWSFWKSAASNMTNGIWIDKEHHLYYWHPCRGAVMKAWWTGGVARASLNHRLLAEMPSASQVARYFRLKNSGLVTPPRSPSNPCRNGLRASRNRGTRRSCPAGGSLYLSRRGRRRLFVLQPRWER